MQSICHICFLKSIAVAAKNRVQHKFNPESNKSNLAWPLTIMNWMINSKESVLENINQFLTLILVAFLCILRRLTVINNRCWHLGRRICISCVSKMSPNARLSLAREDRVWSNFAVRVSSAEVQVQQTWQCDTLLNQTVTTPAGTKIKMRGNQPWVKATSWNDSSRRRRAGGELQHSHSSSSSSLLLQRKLQEPHCRHFYTKMSSPALLERTPTTPGQEFPHCSTTVLGIKS